MEVAVKGVTVDEKVGSKEEATMGVRADVTVVTEATEAKVAKLAAMEATDYIPEMGSHNQHM